MCWYWLRSLEEVYLSEWSYILDVDGIFMGYFNKTLEVEFLSRKINTSKFCIVPSHLKSTRYACKQGREINAKSWTIGNNFNCFRSWNSFTLKLYSVRTCKKSGDSFPCFLTLGSLLSWFFAPRYSPFTAEERASGISDMGPNLEWQPPRFILWKFKPQ
jgi:hypothetical protein